MEIIKNEGKRNRVHDGLPIINMENIGVNFFTGNRREDLQSISFSIFNRNLNERKRLWALQRFNFTGYQGETIGIIGSNGSGKTTFCRVLSGLIKPDTGEITINGNVTALFSLGTGFNNELSGIENIFLNGYMLGLSRKKIMDLLPSIVDFSGLANYIYEPLKKYSSGMYARLGFAIAAMVEPEIFVIDEALSVGDYEFEKKAGEKIKKIVDASKIVVIVSHNLAYIEDYCSRAIWVEEGTVVADGDPHNVVADYKKTIPTNNTSCLPKELFRKSGPVSDKIVIKTENLGVAYKITSSRGNINTRLNLIQKLLKQKEILWVLHNLDLTVFEGEILGVIGLNGAGKTTLCRVIAEILTADQGHIIINGETAALLSFGAGFNIQLTGKDNIYLNGLMMGISKERLTSLYDDIVDFSELGEYIHKPVKHYSNGMNARLGFSIAAMLTPDLFIVDEALNAGDASFYEKASLRMNEMLDKAKAVLVVTHNLQFVEEVCTRVIWLDKGRLIFNGNATKAVNMYKNAMW